VLNTHPWLPQPTWSNKTVKQEIAHSKRNDTSVFTISPSENIHHRLNSVTLISTNQLRGENFIPQATIVLWDFARNFGLAVSPKICLPEFEKTWHISRDFTSHLRKTGRETFTSDEQYCWYLIALINTTFTVEQQPSMRREDLVRFLFKPAK
jgi:hypothetical protein